MAQLVLGTAQWGTGYGITSRVARMDDDELDHIIEVAHGAGITAVDTAPAYGDAEQRLRPYTQQFAITTKVAGRDPAAIRELIGQSLQALGLPRVSTVLLHDWDALDESTAKAAAAALEQCREVGLVQSVGVSAYEAWAIDRAMGTFEHLDAIQVPANALDRRLDRDRAVLLAHDQGVRIAVRSAFLQGLLADPSRARLAQHPAVGAVTSWAELRHRSGMAAALDHVRALPWAAEIVVGVTSASELTEIVEAAQGEPRLAPADLGCEDLDLIDPRRWRSP